ncbi:diacylglycerol kinase family protein [Roseibacterium sp. SDUM158017]|uniref:diacylglycerol/lipid kinase family protein n=1 Tax=Roseicyclus salinarum TaxID=3036773 RepID=UPI0024155492|nr:diacylglycerol kinase family protein [Roseibacterium sp. SDUM158017]MDG4649709.1 diacylglycerol kinase family protein [Roseibacterium sp. SDUM158017]
MSSAICVIVNPHAGGTGTSDRGTEVREALAEAGVEAEIRPMAPGRSPEDAAREALAAAFDTIVAAGGDGTVSGVANAVLHAGGGARLGLLPFGTFNFFARGLSLPLDPAGAAACLRDGATRGVAVGTVNGRVFLNNMSLGLYPSILDNREDVYARWGRSRAAAYWSVLTTLTGMHRPMRLTLDTDGTRERMVTPLVFVAASAYQLDAYSLQGADAVREGRLALFAARKARAADLVRSAVALARGRAREGEEFDMRTGRAFEIHPHKARVLVARDGEREHMATPLRVAFSERPIEVIVPRPA